MLSRTTNFYSHASCEARPLAAGRRTFPGHFYSHASCEARRSFSCCSFKLFVISTHTPLARRDDVLVTAQTPDEDFYSHASCEARLGAAMKPTNELKFLLTRLLRGATMADFLKDNFPEISTHTPLARRDHP